MPNGDVSPQTESYFQWHEGFSSNILKCTKTEQMLYEYTHRIWQGNRKILPKIYEFERPQRRFTLAPTMPLSTHTARELILISAKNSFTAACIAPEIGERLLPFYKVD